MINIGHATDDPFAAFDKNGLPPHLHILAGDAVHLPDAGAATTDGTSIPAMSAALWQFVRVRHGMRLGSHGMEVFDGGRGGKDGASYRHANAHVPPPRSTRDGIGTPASAAVTPTADGGTKA
ncbi:hypothetical protein ACIRYZ_23375 [Kitasatospora sp. NPDC101155]|uniref:hypothetical protein n=1 Tax=Kitasatospora sp. NPDC101155 TaxID=3364097 RepID=UPI00380FEA04